MTSAIAGTDVGMGALTGAISGAIAWGVGYGNMRLLDGAIPEFWIATGGGALGGGVGAELQGGDFWEGAAYGAAGAAVALPLGDIIHGYVDEPDPSPMDVCNLEAYGSTKLSATKPISNAAVDLLTKVWVLPFTAMGFAYGILNYTLGAYITIGHNAVEFNNVLGARDNGFTLGNSILYARPTAGMQLTRLQMWSYGDQFANSGLHEAGHTWQWQRWGPLFPIRYLGAGPFATLQNSYEFAANIFGRGGFR